MKPYAIDIDDVLGDLKNHLYSSLKLRFPHVGRPEDWGSFNFCAQYGIPLCDFLSIIVEDQLLSKIPFSSGAVDALHAIRSSGAQIVLITSRGYYPNALEITKEWLGDAPYDDLIIVEEGQNKAQAALSRYPGGFAFMIDDYPKNLDDMKAAGLVEHTILIDQPWNRSRTDYKHNASRFASLRCFVEFLKNQAYRADLRLPERNLELIY